MAERSPLLGAGIAVQPIDLNTKTVVPQAPEIVTLDATRRAEMIAFVEASHMPAPVKTRLIDQLEQDEVPSTVIARLEERMGTWMLKTGGILSCMTRHATAANLLLVVMLAAGLAAIPKMRGAVLSRCDYRQRDRALVRRGG